MKSLASSGPRRSSKLTTPRPMTPSNPANSSKSISIVCIRIKIKFSVGVAQQFRTYDNDDGRSSRACQDVEDEECFNQLREELTSQCSYRDFLQIVLNNNRLFLFLVGMASPGWDASLSEHVLKNLRDMELPFSEKDLQDNLTMLETKLR